MASRRRATRGYRRIQKLVQTPGPYAPGDEVQFIVQVSCSDPNNVPCSNAVFTDEMPDGFELLDASIVSGPGGGEVTVDTDNDVATATWPTFANGQQAYISFTVQIDEDLPFSESGVPITNTATIDADNADEESAEASVTPEVELVTARVRSK